MGNGPSRPKCIRSRNKKSRRVSPHISDSSSSSSSCPSPAVINTVGHIVINTALGIKGIADRLSNQDVDSGEPLVEGPCLRSDLREISEKVDEMISSLKQNFAYASARQNGGGVRIHQTFEMKTAEFFSMFDGILWERARARVEWDRGATGSIVITQFDPRILQAHVVSMLGGREMSPKRQQKREDAYDGKIAIRHVTETRVVARVTFFVSEKLSPSALPNRFRDVLPTFSGIDVAFETEGSRTKVCMTFGARILEEERGSRFGASSSDCGGSQDESPMYSARDWKTRQMLFFETSGSSSSSSSSAAAAEDAGDRRRPSVPPAPLSLVSRPLIRARPSLRIFTEGEEKKKEEFGSVAAGSGTGSGTGSGGEGVGSSSPRLPVSGELDEHQPPVVITSLSRRAVPVDPPLTTSSFAIRRTSQTLLPPLPPDRIKVRAVTSAGTISDFRNVSTAQKGGGGGGGGGGSLSPPPPPPPPPLPFPPTAFSVREPAIRTEAKVLVVDDEISCVKILANCLKDIHEARTMSAGDGVEAVRTACVFVPDIVFMDISMPQMDGLEASRRIWEISRLCNRSPPEIYIVSANLETVQQINRDREGCMYIRQAFAKPVDRKTVREIVYDYVSRNSL